LIAAPALVSVPIQTGSVGAPIYIGLGGNHDLYVRTATQGWRPLDDLPVYASTNPGSTIIGSTLTIACQGGDYGLYRVQGAVPAQGVPPFFSRNSWQGLGASSRAGRRSLDGSVWHRTASTGWINDGGIVQYGVGASYIP